MFVSQIFDECAEILGTSSSEKVFRKISQAVQTLMESGHWAHSTAEVDVCTGWDGMSLTLPRGVDVPLAINTDGSPLYFRNRLFQYHVNKGGRFNPVEWAWDDRGFTATLMQIIQPAQLVAVAEVENDVGKQIRVLGTNKNNIPLRSQLEDGTGVDGMLVPIHSTKDFPYGIVLPDNISVETRKAAISPINKFTTTTAHQMDSGQGVNLQNISGTIPVPLSNGQVYYIGVIDAFTIQLFNDQNNAKAGEYPLALQSIVNAGQLRIRDSKPSSVVTALDLTTAPTIGIGTANPVVFPTQALPIPLVEKVTYFANLIDPTHLQIFESISDAQNNINPVYTTGSTNPIQIDIRKEITPETKLTFSLEHYFQDGDMVQAFTAGGTLPTPLIANQNYFVNVIDAFAVTLHTSQADAANSSPTNPINPIVITDSGSGTNYLVKLIASSFRAGETSQITAPNLQIPAPVGAGAQFQAVVTGSIRVVQVNAQGAGYLTVPQVTFSPPPEPPVGSNQQAETATGYAIINTISKKVEQIIVTNAGLGYVTPPAITIDAPTATNIVATISNLTFSGNIATVTTSAPHGFETSQTVTIAGVTSTPANVFNKATTIVKTSDTEFTYTIVGTPVPTGVTFAGATATYNPNPQQATATATIETSFVSYFTKISGGLGYTQAPQVQITGGGGSGATAQAVVNTNTYTNVSITRSGSVATATTSIPHGFIEGQTVTISGSPEPAYNGNKTITSVPMSSQNIQTLTRSGTTVTATFASPHNFNTGQIVTISGVTPVAYNGNYVVSVINSNSFTYQIATSPAAVTVLGTASVPNPTGTTFTFSVAGTPANITGASVFSGEVTALNLITSGTGYTSAPTVVITPSTGVFIEFSSTGTLPSPLVAGTAYRAEAPLETSTGTFTVRNADFSKVNITGGGSGTFYTVLSRSFGVNFTNRWLGDFSSLATGQTIYFGTDFVLPTTSPVIDNGVTPFYLRIVSSKTATIYDSLARANAGGTTGRINVVAFGVGQTYYGIRFNAKPEPYQNLIEPENTLYIQEDEIVRFSTSGTLPSPLVAGTDYKVKVFGDNVRVYTTAGVLVEITTPGVGQLSLDIERIIQPQASTSIFAENSVYETGQALTARPSNGDTLPTGLVAGTTYYVRRVNQNEFELYDTQLNAQNLASTAGRISYTTSGSTAESTFFLDAIDDAIFVKTISQIEKPITSGYVSLYAWDYGRTNDMTLIGYYHPSEVNPQYRRIRLGKNCAWARIAYRVTPPFITSKYDYIPIEHERAIIAAIHAVDMEDKDFADQSARYWQIALAYLKNQQEYIDGHAMTPPQINNITYGDGTDVVIF
jgi:hypothetical protein